MAKLAPHLLHACLVCHMGAASAIHALLDIDPGSDERGSMHGHITMSTWLINYLFILECLGLANKVRTYVLARIHSEEFSFIIQFGNERVAIGQLMCVYLNGRERRLVEPREEASNLSPALRCRRRRPCTSRRRCTVQEEEKP